MSNVIVYPQPVYRPASEIALEDIAAFVNKQWHLTYDEHLPHILTSQRTPVVVARQLANQVKQGWVVTQAGKIIGYADRMANCIDNLWVVPAHRRRGIGTGLMNKMLESMQSSDLRTAQVGCETFNQDAIHFFCCGGF